jgi:hypothetical protein
MKQKIKGKNCAVFCFAGKKKLLFIYYAVIVKQNVYKRSTNYYSHETSIKGYRQWLVQVITNDSEEAFQVPCYRCGTIQALPQGVRGQQRSYRPSHKKQNQSRAVTAFLGARGPEAVSLESREPGALRFASERRASSFLAWASDFSS